MASTGFFGGLSQGIGAAQAQALAQQKQDALEQTQSKALAQAQIDATIQHINEVFKEAAKAGNDPKSILNAVQPLVESAKGLAQGAGMNPAMIDQTVGALAARPPLADSTKHSVVKIGSNLTGEQYGLLEQASGKITPIDASGTPSQPSPSAVISQRQTPALDPAVDTITPGQAARANPPASIPAAPDGTPAQTVAARFPSAPAQETPAGPVLPPDMKPGSEAIDYAIQNNVTGDEFLKALPPKLRGTVKDIAEYRVDPRSLSIRGGHREQLLGLASQYSGHTYDQKFYSSMQAGIKEFTTGGNASPAGQITAGNVAIQHLGTVADGIDKMAAVPGLLDKIAKSGTPIVSYATNALKNKAIRGTSEGQALQSFLTARNRYVEEITKFYAGSQGSEKDRERSIQTLDSALSAGELYSALNTESELLNGKINVLQDRFKTMLAGPKLFDATARKAIPDFPILQEKSAAALDRISKGYFALRAKGAPAVVDYRTYFGGQ